MSYSKTLTLWCRSRIYLSFYDGFHDYYHWNGHWMEDQGIIDVCLGQQIQVYIDGVSLIITHVFVISLLVWLLQLAPAVLPSMFLTPCIDYFKYEASTWRELDASAYSGLNRHMSCDHCRRAFIMTSWPWRQSMCYYLQFTLDEKQLIANKLIDESYKAIKKKSR